MLPESLVWIIALGIALLIQEKVGDANPLKSIALENTSMAHVVDWDKDGDWDILLGTTDGTVRFFEQRDGLLGERKNEQNPFANIQVIWLRFDV